MSTLCAGLWCAVHRRALREHVWWGVMYWAIPIMVAGNADTPK